MSAGSRGRARERQVRKSLEDRGWVVVKAGGSLGVADLVALKAGETARLLEVKSDAAQYGPFNNLGPKRRKALLAAAHKAGANAEVAYFPPYGTLRFIPPSEWP